MGQDNGVEVVVVVVPMEHEGQEPEQRSALAYLTAINSSVYAFVGRHRSRVAPLAKAAVAAERLDASAEGEATDVEEGVGESEAVVAAAAAVVAA